MGIGRAVGRKRFSASCMRSHRLTLPPEPAGKYDKTAGALHPPWHTWLGVFMFIAGLSEFAVLS